MRKLRGPSHDDAAALRLFSEKRIARIVLVKRPAERVEGYLLVLFDIIDQSL